MRRSHALSALGATLLAAPMVLADPPPVPPCDVEIKRVFCFRVTDIRRHPTDGDRWFFEYEIVNWTGEDITGMTVTLNVADGDDNCDLTNNCPPAPTDECDPYIAGASIDRNGRPIGAGSIPPSGNTAIGNDWSVVSQSCTRVEFGGGTAVPHPAVVVNGTTYDGLADPQFPGAGTADCVTALLAMIPGSNASGANPTVIDVPMRETADDGSNVLDGFVLEIDDLDPARPTDPDREQFSLNWFLFGENGVVGMITTGVSGPTLLGDPYGFGTLNFSALDLLPLDAPDPLFTQNTLDPSRVNTGYDPVGNSDPNADDPANWAEDEVNGIDTYAINPIPVGQPGQGITWCVEPGAAVTAPFLDILDATLSDGSIAGTNFLAGTGPEPGLALCFGDGSGGGCPCANTAGGDQGCANSTGQGAALDASGSTSISAGDLVLELTHALPSQPGLFFQGNILINGGNGVSFGDGLRCVGANVVRLQVVVPNASGEAASSVDIAQAGGAQSGDTKYYQCWYRDPGGSPCGNGFNLSNAYQLTYSL